MKKRLFFLISLAMLTNLLSFSFAPLNVQAAEDEIGNLIEGQLEPIGDIYGNPDVDENTFAEAISKIIKIVLGFLGVIFIILIIYAGFNWMTSAGNEEKIEKAKKTMVAAVIGVAIVLMAYAITYFVIDSLLEATTGSGIS